MPYTPKYNHFSIACLPVICNLKLGSNSHQYHSAIRAIIATGTFILHFFQVTSISFFISLQAL